MAINVTNDALNHSANVSQSGHWTCRTSSGIPYVVVPTVGAGIDVYKGNSATPTSFSVQDSANNPNSTYVVPSCAIDGSGIIHISYWYANGKSSAVRYVTFDTATDTYSGDVSVADVGSADPPARTTDIAIDASGIPHITWLDRVANMGTDYDTVYYVNKVGGSWNTPVQIEGTSASKQCIGPSIAIDSSNFPFITYANSTDGDLTQATSSSNNPSSFTLTDRDTTTGGSSVTGTALTSAGTKVSVYHDSDNSVNIYDGATERDSGNLSPISAISTVCVGTDIYVFYEKTTTDDICYDMWNGTSWAGETVLETGTFLHAKAKWSWEFNYDSSGTNRNDSSSAITEIDYCFATANDDIWWNTLTLTAPKSAALSGTIIPATEADIVAGGKTILLTLTNDTWVAAGATFDAQRQNIINGLDSAQVEANGWDAVVKAGLAVAAVVRTSDTVVTITLSAFGSYNITASETITATIPATALTGAEQIIASPTFVVTATVASLPHRRSIGRGIMRGVYR